MKCMKENNVDLFIKNRFVNMQVRRQSCFAECYSERIQHFTFLYFVISCSDDLEIYIYIYIKTPPGAYQDQVRFSDQHQCS